MDKEKFIRKLTKLRYYDVVMAFELAGWPEVKAMKEAKFVLKAGQEELDKIIMSCKLFL